LSICFDVSWCDLLVSARITYYKYVMFVNSISNNFKSNERVLNLLLKSLKNLNSVQQQFSIGRNSRNTMMLWVKLQCWIFVWDIYDDTKIAWFCTRLATFHWAALWLSLTLINHYKNYCWKGIWVVSATSASAKDCVFPESRENKLVVDYETTCWVTFPSNNKKTLSLPTKMKGMGESSGGRSENWKSYTTTTTTPRHFTKTNSHFFYFLPVEMTELNLSMSSSIGSSRESSHHHHHHHYYYHYIIRERRGKGAFSSSQTIMTRSSRRTSSE